MKTKKSNKKLQLNKKTIASLNNTEINVVRGGLDTDINCTYFTCASCGSCKEVLSDPFKTTKTFVINTGNEFITASKIRNTNYFRG